MESWRNVKLDVLVVEDDLFFGVRIEKTLQRLGYTVFMAKSRDEALAMAEEHPPALVIVNFGRDQLEPTEVVRRIKALPHAPPVLGFVSHKWIPHVRPNAMAAGCDLLVANSALSMRLSQLVAKLAPQEGSAINVSEAAQVAEEDEDQD
jgi:CheY-like chemotaxis protein